MIPKELLAQLRSIEIHTARLANENLTGNYASSFKGQGLAFREVRPYQRGDDVRTIDWNVSARMNEPFVKVFSEEREMTVMLVVDMSASERFGSKRADKARVASEVSALVAFSAIHNGDRVGLILSTDKVERMVPPKRGEKHVMRVVREILGFDVAGSGETEGIPAVHKERRAARRHAVDVGHVPLGARTDLSSALEALVRVARRRSVAFLISDFFAEGYEQALALAALKHDLIAVVLTDVRDTEMPDVGLATFEDLETGMSVVVDTSDARVRAAYAAEMRKLVERRNQTIRRLGIDSVEIRTDGVPVKPLRELFQRRARRAAR
ncbi:MAG: DUF58 domain-containing protein [Myxococcales bacterium]|nr:DUF58 domain-containing protein [Myxococcales bacterium]